MLLRRYGRLCWSRSIANVYINTEVPKCTFCKVQMVIYNLHLHHEIQALKLYLQRSKLFKQKVLTKCTELMGAYIKYKLHDGTLANCIVDNFVLLIICLYYHSSCRWWLALNSLNKLPLNTIIQRLCTRLIKIYQQMIAVYIFTISL